MKLQLDDVDKLTKINQSLKTKKTQLKQLLTLDRKTISYISVLYDNPNRSIPDCIGIGYDDVLFDTIVGTLRKQISDIENEMKIYGVEV